MAPYIVLAVLLAITLLLWWSWTRHNAERQRARYERMTADVVRCITGALRDAEMVSVGFAGVFVASKDVTRDEFRAYFEYRRIPEALPGFVEIAFARIVRSVDLAEHTGRMRLEGLPDYRVRPEEGGDLRAPVVFVEPSDAERLGMLGWDLLSDPTREEAARLARATGEPALSGPIPLEPGASGSGALGFLMVIPVYASGAALDTTDERASAVTGYSVTTFGLARFVRETVAPAQETVVFDIHDGSEPSPGTLMYGGPVPDSGRQPRFSHTETIDVYGRHWTIAFRTTEAFTASTDHTAAAGIPATGVLISLLVFLLLRSQERTRKRALLLAEQLTARISESERRYRLLAENSLDVIWTIDLDGRVTYVSPSIERLIGYTPAEVMGMPLSGFIHEEDVERFMERLRSELAKTSEDRTAKLTVEMRHRTKDGRLLDVEFSAFWHYDERGALMGIQGDTKDVTDRKRAERERIAREVAEQADRAKGAFLAHMSHEIRTPLTAILGFANLLDSDPTLPPARRMAAVRSMSRSARHLLQLINDLLDMARIEAGRVVTDAETFRICDLLDDMDSMFRSLAEAKGLDLAVHCEGWVPESIVADRGKLQQVLVNLMANAVKFTDTGSVTVRVATDRTQAPHTDIGPKVLLRFSVQDTGAGIAEEDLDRIFDPFWQATNGRRTEGTGLGLAISRGYIEAMGGEVTVTTDRGAGTVFRFTVPVEIAEAPRETGEEVVEQRSAGEPQAGPGRMPSGSVTTDRVRQIAPAMRKAALEGDMVRLKELIEALERSGAPAAEPLRAMAERYDYERIDALVRRLEATGG